MKAVMPHPYHKILHVYERHSANTSASMLHPSSLHFLPIIIFLPLTIILGNILKKIVLHPHPETLFE